MITLGITGIIGAGKTTVSQIFNVLGIPVYNADTEAKKLMKTNSEIKQNLIKTYGQSVYKNGIPDKTILSNLVFSSSENRTTINNIVHPVVINDFKTWVLQQNKENYKITAIESALLFQARIDKITDYSIEVICDSETAIERIIARDGTNYNQAKNKIEIQKQQIPENSKADFKISNNDNNSLILQCLELIEIIKSKTKID